MKTKLLLIVLVIIFCRQANAQIYDMTYFPDDYLSTIIHESYLKDVYKNYRDIILANKVKRVALEIQKGGTYTINYNNNGLITNILYSNPDYSRYNFFYDENNVISAIDNLRGGSENDSFRTNFYYKNGVLINWEACNGNEEKCMFLQMNYDADGRFTGTKTYVPELHQFITALKADYDSTGKLSGFFAQTGEKYYVIKYDTNSFSFFENNNFVYKYIISDNKIKQLIFGNQILDYFYNEKGLIEYTILTHGNMASVKTVYSYEYY